jgi:serine phosphatase RsbU (regulator of sigma subunit)
LDRSVVRDMLFPPRGWRAAVALVIAVGGPFLSVPIATHSTLARFRGAPFLIAILFASAIGRLALGGAALVLSVVLLDYHFLPPTASVDLRASIEGPLLVFTVAALLGAFLVAERDRAAARALAAAHEASAANERLASMARGLQSRLLPRELPRIDGLELAGRYRAGGEGMDAGGDFYDVFRLDDITWKAVIGDVCGKGAEAASLMGFVRSTIRAISSGQPRPSATLHRVNDLLLEEIDPRDARFCTACIARIHLGEPGVRLTVAVAGHPLPYVVRSDGDVEPVGEPGTLLGLFREITVQDRPVDLAPGDAFVLYTDGAVERPEDPEWQLDGVREELRAVAGGSADEIADRLFASSARPEGRAVDDVAVLVVKVVGGPSVADPFVAEPG